MPLYRRHHACANLATAYLLLVPGILQRLEKHGSGAEPQALSMVDLVARRQSLSSNAQGYSLANRADGKPTASVVVGSACWRDTQFARGRRSPRPSTHPRCS